ncbi:AI-2E family transporter [candidate division WWE3 bacterium]|nr:AI-2E family transporter [candidate division WWE3 bacterium]
MDRDIVISIKTVLFTLALFFGVYVVYRLGPIFAIILVSTLLVMALEPAVQFFMNKVLMNRPVPRSLAVSATFILFLLALAFVVTSVVPPVVNQIRNLFGVISTGISKLSGFDISPFVPKISDVSGGVISVTVSFFSNIFTVLSVLVITLYMSLDWVNLKMHLISLFPQYLKAEVEEVVQGIEASIGHWIKGQIFLMIVIGVTTFFGLLVLDVDYPLALAMMSGLLEIVPVLGPVVSGALASLVAFTSSPIKGLAVIGFFVLLQQMENSLLVPKVMQKVSGFSPLVIIFALLIGSTFFGVVGALIAIPVTMIIVIIVKHLLGRAA